MLTKFAQMLADCCQRPAGEGGHRNAETTLRRNQPSANLDTGKFRYCMKKGRGLCREERGPTLQERPSRDRIWRIGPSGVTQAGRSSARPALSQPYSPAHRGDMTAEQQSKKLNKIHLGTGTHGFHTRTVLKAAKGSVTAPDFLTDERQVVIRSGKVSCGGRKSLPDFHQHSLDVETARTCVRPSDRRRQIHRVDRPPPSR
jgi:hypothetical protein